MVVTVQYEGKRVTPRFIYLHGIGSMHWSFGFAPSLKREIEALGFETFFETMPDSIAARAQYWLPFLEHHVGAGENDVLIGWSTGALAAMRYAETHRIAGSILISPAHTDLGLESERFSGYFETPWNWPAIRANQERIAAFWGDDDPYIGQDEFAHVAAQLQPEAFPIPGGKHFVERTELPEVIAYIRETYGG